MRQCGASQNDLDILLAKQFVLAFERGVIVIKHWYIHNYIRADRYRETKYKDFKLQLENSEKGYERLPSGIPVVDKMDTEDRLGKDRLGKDSNCLEGIVTMSTSESENAEQVGGSEANPPCPFSKIGELYHTHCPSYPRLRAISGNRRKAVAARWREYPNLQTFRELFIKAEASKFLKGFNNRNWRADFDWFMKPSNMQKVLEGKYDDNKAPKPQSGALDTLRKMYQEVTE